MSRMPCTLELRSSSMGFDLRATNMVKGVALCLLLWHHLFYKHPEFGLWVYNSALVSKICVTIFVVLSGYGLFVSSQKMSLLSFYRVRLSKLYFGFWSIYLIFVPISWLCFGRGAYVVFGGWHYAVKTLYSFLGLQVYYGGPGFNATWWFMSAIIPLYLLFPLLSWCVKRYCLLILLIAYFIPNISVVHCLNIPVVYFPLILPFVCGMAASKYDLFCLADSLFSTSVLAGRRIYVVVLSVLLLLVVYLNGSLLCLYEQKIGILFAFWIIQVCFLLYGSSCFVAKSAVGALAFIGRHSMNIFLFHTFIFYYFFPNFFYSFRIPGVIFFVLLVVCLVVSVALEKLKSLVGINIPQQKVKPSSSPK